jgi:SAM-dependent methyltransferase
MVMTDVTSHYASTGIVERILERLRSAGHDTDAIDADVLATVDEFHLGGRAATTALVDALAIPAGAVVVDVGSGIGGAARVMTLAADCDVVGVDLTPEFVGAANQLSALVGLDGSTRFELGNGDDLPFADGGVDVVTMLHVGMNIADKVTLMAEFARVLRPGGVLGVYDIMRVGPGEISYPVPWATDAGSSFVTTPDDYAAAMEAGGFVDVEVVDRAAFVLELLASGQGVTPPVHLGDLMGERFGEMIANLVPSVRAGVLAPVQITGRR